VVHLICLRCNRTNAAEAKFCVECGAGLLRKFCAECHSVNDAESHFCQSCGARLPVQPSVQPHASAPPASTLIPDLTDIAFPQPDAPQALPIVPQSSDLIIDAPPPWSTAPAAAAPAGIAGLRAAARIYRAPIALGACAAAALVLAWSVWPRTPPALQLAASAPAAPALRTPDALAVAPPFALPEPVVGVMPSAAAPPDTGVAPQPQAPLPAGGNNSDKPRRVRADPPSAAQPAPAAPPRDTTAERARAARPRASTPVLECTPAADAMGLCAPGAQVAGR
jgi:hypothetical protein